MIAISGVVLTGILVLVLGVCLLVFVGMRSMRTGQQALARARVSGEEILWHKQPSILFGLNNFVFAVLLVFVLLMGLLVVPIWRDIMFGLVILTLLVSLFLVTRTILSSLEASKRYRQRRTGK